MNLRPKPLLIGLALLGLAFANSPAAPLRILYFTKSAGYEHSVVRWDAGHSSYSQRVLSKLAPANDFVFTFSKDGSLFSKDYFDQFDVVVFYTTGDLLTVGNDGQPAVTVAGKEALLNAIEGGKGFVGLHACSDTWHTHEHGGGNPTERQGRYHNNGDDADPFVKMLGGEFIRHNAQQVAPALVVAPDFPGFGGLGTEIKVQEEWYTLKNFAPDLHVLLVMKTENMRGPDYQRPDYPLAWARKYGKGRVAYNAMGHREDVWDSAGFQAMVVGMLKWAGHQVDADLTPNLGKVASEASTLQKWVALPEKK
ncbi:MAG TPA: ThuA domain-containing protein [Opitutus sp.]|nr:ThuA domain-containing protein [Opitutus sp.]